MIGSTSKMMMAAASTGVDDGTVSENRLLYLNAANSASYSGTGTTWYDLSGNGYNGTLTNGPVWNSTYFEFDGDDDYVEMGTIPVNHPLQLNAPSGGGITIMFALWFDGTGDVYQRIVDKSNGGSGANGYCIFPNSGVDVVAPFLFYSDVGSGASVSAATSPTASTWQIWSMTLSTGGSAEWRVNNSTTNSTTSSYAIPNVETNMRIGTWNHSTARELNGRLGFIMIYDKVLNSSELTQNYDALKATYGLT